MKSINPNKKITFNEVHATCTELSEDFPEYKLELTHSKRYGPMLTLTHFDDDKLVYILYTERLFDVDCVEENKLFVDRLNGFIAKHYPPEPINWDRRFLKMAMGEINTWSKDPSTKVSATLFKGKHPIASSYNGFPPGVEDTYERLNNRELKYKIVQHAEANCIAVSSKLGIATEGCTIAVTHFPCTTCAGQMIVAGIKKVICNKPKKEFEERWGESQKLAREILEEAGVELVVIDMSKDE